MTRATPESSVAAVGPADADRRRSSGQGWAASPTRQFVVLSLLTIGASTFLFGAALAHFVEQGILDREWTSTAALVRAAAHVQLRPGDFTSVAGQSGQKPARPSDEAADRFEELTRQVRMLPDVLRVVIYDGHGQPLWTDDERAQLHGGSALLAQALGGETSVRLDRGGDTSPRVELYVPITFAGEGRVAGLVETYLDPTRVLATVRRARITLWSLAMVSGAVLFAALYGIVWRASRTLRAQHAALAQRADALTRANAELRTVQQQLVAAERLAAFGEITAAVAHGLGNPLAAIRGLAQVAQADTPAGAARERLGQLIAETDRLTERMRGLLRYGRPVEQRQVPTSLDAAVADALQSARRRAEGRGVQVEVTVPPDLPKVRLDPACFEEAFLCLVNNALDAMADGGVLRIASGPAPGRPGALQLTVSDTGPGMSPAVVSRAFDPFFTTKKGGTGLGLAVARKLLEGAGGGLALESEPGRGTRAVITLPIEEA